MEKNVIYKRLIEHRLPLNEISTESAKEKSVRHGHISTLHLWWARRPLAASRAAVFGTLVPDTEQNFELVKRVVPWDAVKDGNQDPIQEARKEILNSYNGVPPKVLDPFGGGGAIPLEALRLGCDTYSLDLNPVAHLIQRATLEFPQKYGQKNSRTVPDYIIQMDDNSTLNQPKNGVRQDGFNFAVKDGAWQQSYKRNPLSTDVRYWGNWVLERAAKELSSFFPPEKDGRFPIAYLWARTVTCTNPQCRCEVPLVRQWWLLKKDKKSLAIKPIVNNKLIEFSVVEVDKSAEWPNIGTIQRGNTVCPSCGNVISSRETQEQAKAGTWGERMMIVITSSNNESGKNYRTANHEDLHAFQRAKLTLEALKTASDFDGIALLPNEPIPYDPRAFTPCIYGFSEWGQLFNYRQALTLVTFAKYVRECYKHILEYTNDQEYSRAITTYLGLAVDKVADYNSNLCTWANHGEYIGHVFTRQALPMVWDYAETVPIHDTSGNWQGAVEWGYRVIDHASLSSDKPATVLRGSATRIPIEDNTLDAIVTDPPYYDAVPYADLSDYFYVWLKRSIGHLYPEHFRTPSTPKAQEAVQNALRHNGDNLKAKVFFEETMAKAFSEMNRVLKPEGEATIVFAHKSTDAWETLISALIKAGFRVEASWPLRTEMGTRLRAQASAALASSTFLNCTKRVNGGIGYFNDVRKQMMGAIKPQLKEFWESGIRGADFLMSAIGPGLESYSRYDEVRKISGEPVTVGEFLDEVRKIVMDFALSQVLGAASTGAVDHSTQFTVLALWGYGTELPSDEARKLAQSVGVQIPDLGSLIKVSGEKAKLLSIKEREKASKNLGISEAGSTVSMIDAIHKAVLLLPEGRQKIANYLAGVGYLDQEVFWQTMQAVAEVLEGEADGRSMHELLTIRDNLPKGETAATQGSLGF